MISQDAAERFASVVEAEFLVKRGAETLHAPPTSRPRTSIGSIDGRTSADAQYSIRRRRRCLPRRVKARVSPPHYSRRGRASSVMMPVEIREGAATMLEVKSVPKLLGTPVSYAYAVKAGPWIFLTGHEAFDFESGIPEEVAGPAGFPLFGRPRSRREGDFILQRMRRILREFGSDLGKGVRLDQYYPSPAAVDPYLPVFVPPASAACDSASDRDPNRCDFSSTTRRWRKPD
jgi:hypothetical protein